MELIEIDNIVNHGNYSETKQIKEFELKSKKDELKLCLLYDRLFKRIFNDLLQRKEKLIIEGIQIIHFYGDENYILKLLPYSIIVKGTSAIKSFFQAYRRNKTEDWAREWSSIEIMIDIYHNLFINKFNMFTKLVKQFKTSKLTENKQNIFLSVKQLL